MTESNWRELCRELVDELHGYASANPHHDSDALVARARDALAAEPEPEAVGPTDDSGKVWQWYTYCPEEGIDLYSSREQAQSATQSIMGSYAVAAHSDGWHEDMELVSWGMLVPVERAQVVARETAEPGNEFDEWVKYELRPARATLAADPVGAPAGPTDQELDALERQCYLPACEGTPKPGNQPCAVCGHPAPAADGAVELAWWLRSLEDASVWFESGSPEALKLTRAADLLEQRHPAPVPASERKPGPRDCDAEGRCWWFCTECPGEHPYWILAKEVYCDPIRWLPAHALPLPSGEVQP